MATSALIGRPNPLSVVFETEVRSVPELTERLDSLRRSEGFCDVTVAVKRQEFKAHKVVLAASSPLFLSLRESDMKESNEQRIRTELEEATASVMEDVLRYVYTNLVPRARAHLRSARSKCHGLWVDYGIIKNRMPLFRLPVF